MIRAVAVTILGATAFLAAGCAANGTLGTTTPSIEFVAANSSSVLIDYTGGAAADMNAVKQMATQKCALFGGHSVTLESLNVRGDGKERAAFLCQ